MTNMTQETFLELTQVVITQAIYGASKQAGEFVQGIWLFEVPEKPEDGPIISVAVEVPSGDKVKYAIAYARRAIQAAQTDFTIVASQATILGGKSPYGEAYGFYCQAPGLQPITLIQRFHHDPDGFVVLDGQLVVPASSRIIRTTDDPWLPPTAEDLALLKEGNMMERTVGYGTNKGKDFRFVAPKSDMIH